MSDYATLKNEADNNYKDKNYKNAIAKYTEALSFVKSNSDEYIICHNNIAQCYIELNDFANAIEHAFLVIKKEKTNEKALARIRVCYKKLGYDKLGPQCNDTYKDTTSPNGHCSIARELMNLNPHQDFFAKSEGKSGGDNAQIVHTYHKIPGDGNCFFSSVYTCLENAKLLDNLNFCFESYDQPIVLDTKLSPIEQYIKALREMCIKSEEYKKNLYGLYEAFFTNDAELMKTLILDSLSYEQLNALGFETKYKQLSPNIKLTPKLVTAWGLKWQTNLSYGSLSLIDLLSANQEIATIYYSETRNYTDRTFGVLDLESIKRIIGKGNDPKRKERYMTKMQELNNIDVLLKNKPWATEFEVSFLTRKLKECGKISIVVKYVEMTTKQPIVDEHGNQIIYVLNKNQTHFDAYLRTKPTALPSNTSGGGGGAEMALEWSCTACTFLNKNKKEFCEMCGTPKPKLGGSRQKRKSAKKRKSKQRKTRARRTKSRRHSS